MCLNRHMGHQKQSALFVYSACCKSKSTKQYVHFTSLGIGLPRHTGSLSCEYGPCPSLFLKATSVSYRMPGCNPTTSTSRAGNGTGSGSCGTRRLVAELTYCQDLAPSARNLTEMPVSGGTTVNVCHLTRMWFLFASTTNSRGSLGVPGMPGSFRSPMHADLLTGDSSHQRPLTRNATVASYSIPSSRPRATVLQSGAGMAVPPQRYQLGSPTRRSFTVVDFASSGSLHLTFIFPAPAPIGSRRGASDTGPVCSTSSMPVDCTRGSLPDTASSLGSEYSPKPSALRQQIAATYSTLSSTPLMFTSKRVAAKVVLPPVTSFPLPASTSIFLPTTSSVNCTCDASTGGKARGIAQEHLNLPGASATSFGGAGAGGGALGFGSPSIAGSLGSETSPQPSLFIIAMTAS
mmetsp:Transcript_66356/g.186906  ORF Transcript_66356/g.186906 Transcript_66356/m.186906 type:complete len:405 (-) Transcript_66356:262-1476(-)